MKRLMAGFVSLALSGLVGSQVSAQKLQGTGATFPAPVYSAWIAEFTKANPGATLDYQATGSGAGIKGILDKTVDFAGSDAPMSKAELAKAGVPILQIPAVAGAVVLAYNLPDLKQPLKLDGPLVADIFLGKVKTWNDPRITSLNQGVSLPSTAITTVHRTDGSGTNYVFTNYLASQSEEFDSKVGAGKTVEWPNGQGGKGSDGVAQIVQGTPGAIGYAEHNYAVKNKIPFADMKNKDGKFVTASAETVSAAGQGALARMEKSLAVSIWNQPGDNAYPISSFTYILVYQDLSYMKDPAKAKVLHSFLAWAAGDGQKLVTPGNKLEGYAPLSEGVQKKVLDAVNSLTDGGQPIK